MSPSILITGASGTLGKPLLRALQARGLEAAVTTSQPGKHLEGFRTLHADFGDPASLEAAFKGFETVFLLQPLVPSMKHFGLNAVRAAKAVGIQHIVRSSGAGADASSPFSIAQVHGEIDEAVKASGCAWTLLRPNSFMQNLLSFSADMIRQGTVFAPHGTGATALVDVRDLGDAAAAVLADPKAHEGATYTLTGNEALTDAQQMEVLSEILGRNVNYVDIPEDVARESLNAMGMPSILVDWLMSLNAVVKAGYAAAIHPELSQLMGHSPRSFRTFVQEHAEVWA